MAVFTKGLYNCACDRTVCDWSCTTYATMMSDLVPNTVVGYVPPLKKTNADRIRAMTDEELDGFLNEVQGDAYLVGFHARAESRFTLYGKSWLDWLKQEASE